MSVRLISSTY